MTEYEIAVQIADTYMQAMSAGDFDRVVALYADDATLEDPVGSEVLSGKSAISEFYHGITGTQITCTRTGPVRYANRELVFPFECSMKAPGMNMTVSIIDHFVLNDDDKVVSMRAFWSQDTTTIES